MPAAATHTDPMHVIPASLRVGTDAEWASRPLPMPQGEWGYATDTGEVKFGNGVPWSATPVLTDLDGAPMASLAALALVASSGAYGDLSGSPAIPNDPSDIGAETPAGAQAKADAAQAGAQVAAEAALSTALADHEAAADPHPGYVKEPASPTALPTVSGLAVANIPLVLGGNVPNTNCVTVVNNTRDRLNALETKLKALGILPA